jgi:hypothetical protein
MYMYRLAAVLDTEVCELPEQQMSYTGSMRVGFRPTEADSEILNACRRPGETNSDVLRRGLRALRRQEWEERAREDMARIVADGEAPRSEADTWEYDEQAASTSPGRASP